MVKQMKIKLYGSAWCPFCVKEKEFLESKNIDFEYIDVSKDSKAGEYMVNATKQNGIPVTEIIENNKSEFIVGFNEDYLIKRLKIK